MRGRGTVAPATATELRVATPMRGTTSVVLLFLFAFSIFLSHEAMSLHSPATAQNIVKVIRKGGGGGGGFRGGGGTGARGSSSPYGKSIPLIAGATMIPRTSGSASPKLKHNAAHSSHNVSIVALLIIAAFWLQSLASM